MTATDTFGCPVLDSRRQIVCCGGSLHTPTAPGDRRALPASVKLRHSGAHAGKASGQSATTSAFTCEVQFRSHIQREAKPFPASTGGIDCHHCAPARGLPVDSSPPSRPPDSVNCSPSGDGNLPRELFLVVINVTPPIFRPVSRGPCDMDAFKSPGRASASDPSHGCLRSARGGSRPGRTSSPNRASRAAGKA